jgi:hypothetical protein
MMKIIHGSRGTKHQQLQTIKVITIKVINKS